MSKTLKRYKINKKNIKSTTMDLISLFGIPEIYTDYAVYFKNINDDFPQVYLNLNPISNGFRFIGGKSMLSKNNKKLKLNSKDVFSFIKSLPEIGYNTFTAGESFVSKWLNKEGNITIYENSLIGDFITVSFFENSFIEKLAPILDCLEEIVSISTLVNSEVVATEKNIITTSGSLSSELINILHLNSIPIKNKVTSIHSIYSSKSNDYSEIEKYLENKFSLDLVQNQFTNNFNFKIEDVVSVIIPSFNSENTITKVLDSIESQNLSLDEKKLIEVVVVDDGSKLSVLEKLKNIDKYSFSLKISTSGHNQGLAKSRNIGMGIITGFITIFIDSDILLPKNYIKEHYLRHKFIPNALIMSFKENINESNISDKDINEGMMPSKHPNDSRLFKKLGVGSSGIYANTQDQEINILEETNYFKNFGYGRVIGNYDLSTMVIGHNLSIRTYLLRKIGRFNTDFKGWGLEDSFFGAECIVNNMWIIPVLVSNVYHLNHPPRSGSEEQKKAEFEYNLNIYKGLINKEI